MKPMQHPPRLESALQVLGRLAGLAGLAFGLSTAHATIAEGINATGAQASYRGNGELFFMALDPAAKVSYTLDLGLTQDQFFISGQQDAGSQQFWAIDSANWQSFLSRVDASKLVWAVMAYDVFGTGEPGGFRWYTTVTQGTEAAVGTLTNQSLQTVMGRSTRFFGAVNFTGTHGVTGVAKNYAVNGDSVNASTDPTGQYFGGDAVAPKMDNIPYQTANPVGSSSWFYYLTRSGTNQGNAILVDEFDNLGHDAYFGFTYVEPGVDSPYAGRHLLSYTMQAATLTQTQREFAAGIGRTEFNGAFHVQRLAGEAAAAQEAAAGFGARRLPGVALEVPMPPVPEPGTTALLLAGLATLAGLGRRRLR